MFRLAKRLSLLHIFPLSNFFFDRHQKDIRIKRAKHHMQLTAFFAL